MLYNVAQLLKEGIGATRQREIEGELRGIDELNPGPVPVTGEAKLVRTPGGILVTARAQLALVQPCRRCLELTTTPVDISFEEEFTPSLDVVSGLPLPEAEKSEDPELLIDEHHILDLSELLRQYAVMEAVRLALCSPDCKGLCPTCGQNLNLGSCGCTDRAVDPRLAELAKLLPREPDEDQQMADPEKG
ncbi:MAG: DUF177 domain-containing protein [Chloroflexi bacterium]|nr:DUF177 domain-containing protein [Chloroflexota bacterium]